MPRAFLCTAAGTHGVWSLAGAAQPLTKNLVRIQHYADDNTFGYYSGGRVRDAHCLVLIACRHQAGCMGVHAAHNIYYVNVPCRWHAPLHPLHSSLCRTWWSRCHPWQSANTTRQQSDRYLVTQTTLWEMFTTWHPSMARWPREEVNGAA